MSILVIGQTGQLAQAFAETQREFPGIRDVKFLPRSIANLSYPASLRSIIFEYRPSIVINAAAYTAVDQAETNEDEALTVNADAPEAMAGACRELDIPFIHFSTDYVFSGEGTQPWHEEDEISPLSAYGRTKAEGESRVRSASDKHLIFRTSWVYYHDGKNFVRTMLRLGSEREKLSVVNDQIGSPSSALALARATWQAAEQALRPDFKQWGVYHMVGGGYISWHGFAEAIFAEALRLGFSIKAQEVQPISTNEFPTPARRPLNSRLNTDKLKQVFGIELPPWRESLNECLQKIAAREHLK